MILYVLPKYIQYYFQYSWFINLGFTIVAFKQNLQQINMKNIILVLALAYLSLSDVIIQSSASSDFNNNLVRYRLDENGVPEYAKIKQAHDAAWIWDENPTPTLNEDSKFDIRLPDMKMTTRTKQFSATCLAQMTIYAASNKIFYIYINDNLLISGTDPIQYSATFTPRCGINTFTMVIFYNTIPIGFIYSIVQKDTSACYKCPYYWNSNTCSCERCIPIGCNTGPIHTPQNCNCECAWKYCQIHGFLIPPICNCQDRFKKIQPRQ